MAKPELGTKRLCASCGAKFYDLNKDPIHCPKCGTVYEVAPVVTRGRPDAAAARPAPAAEEVATPEPQEVETVSLEEADAEASGAKKPATTMWKSTKRSMTMTTTLSSRSRKKRIPMSPISSAATSRTKRKDSQEPISRRRQSERNPEL